MKPVNIIQRMVIYSEDCIYCVKKYNDTWERISFFSLKAGDIFQVIVGIEPHNKTRMCTVDIHNDSYFRVLEDAPPPASIPAYIKYTGCHSSLRDLRIIELVQGESDRHKQLRLDYDEWLSHSDERAAEEAAREERMRQEEERYRQRMEMGEARFRAMERKKSLDGRVNSGYIRHVAGDKYVKPEVEQCFDKYSRPYQALCHNPKVSRLG